MIVRIDEYDMKQAFDGMGYDFTLAACRALLAYYNDDDPDCEFNANDIAHRWTEYGGNAYYSIEDLTSDYGYLLDADPRDYVDEDEMITDLMDELDDHTTVLRTGEGSFVVDTEFDAR